MEKVNIKHVNNLHNDWLRALDFYATELGFMKGRLTEIAGKNTDKEILALVERYENQFKIQKENIDILSHDIRANVSEIAKQAEHSSAGFIDGELLVKHANLEKGVMAEEKEVLELRNSFNVFTAKWL
jgi:hypothetical protein